MTKLAGNLRGFYFLPEVDDEVLVAFEQGDARFPYVVGALWNGKDAPPEKNDDGQNNVRAIKSRSGHVIRPAHVRSSRAPPTRVSSSAKSA